MIRVEKGEIRLTIVITITRFKDQRKGLKQDQKSLSIRYEKHLERER